MKDLTGTASSTVDATTAQCMAVLADVERYPEWYPDVVRRVEVLERGPSGQATKAQTTLHVVHSHVARDFDLTLDVRVQPPDVVRLVRIPHEPTDEERFEVNWRVREGVRRTIELGLAAALPVPRLVPVRRIGDGLAQGFVAAAADRIRRSG